MNLNVHSRWRELLNFLGIFVTLCILLSFLLSLGFAIHSFQLPYLIWALVSLFFNYVVTIFLSVHLMNSSKKSDLFISFCLFIFLLFPCLGVFLYFLLGFDSIHQGNEHKRNRIIDRYRNYEERLNSRSIRIEDLYDSSSKTFSYNLIKHDCYVYAGNNFQLLSDPSSILNEIASLIKGARRFIHLEFYIFVDGLVADYLIDLLEVAVLSGVEVRLMVDYLGSIRRLSRKTRRRLRNSGIHFTFFNPFFRFNNLWWQFRNHNKLIVVDNEYAFCGSCNIADEYFNITRNYFQTTELCLKITGPIVTSINSSFCTRWGMFNRRPKKGDPLLLDGMSYFRGECPGGGSVKAQFISSSPVSNEHVIKDNLVQLIFNAEKSITISTPYFYPPKELIFALQQASVYGIKVKLLLPKQADLNDFFRHLNRQLFSRLLPYNIEIYEYFGFNHEKVMIIDDETVYFGSYNWDYRSIYLNFENSVLLKCSKLTSELHQFMERQLKNSQRIVYGDLNTKLTTLSSFYMIFIRIFKPFL